MSACAPINSITNRLGWYLPDWSDFELRLAIDFAPFAITARKKKVTIRPTFSWKRAREVVMIAGKPSIGLTTPAKHWAKAAAAQFVDQWFVSGQMTEPIPREIQINAAIVSYLPTAAVTDSSNLYQGPEDILQSHKTGKRPCKPKCRVHAGIIVDDAQIKTHNESDRLMDRNRCRVEITLTPYSPGRARRHPVQEDLVF